MEQKKLVEQLIKASNEISKNRKPSANYIHLSEGFIQQQADDNTAEIEDSQARKKQKDDEVIKYI